MAPKMNELQHMLRGYWLRPSGVVALSAGQRSGVSLDGELKTLEIGKGEVLREGSDLAVIAIGSTVYPALAAVKRLSEEGFNIKSLCPFC